MAATAATLSNHASTVDRVPFRMRIVVRDHVMVPPIANLDPLESRIILHGVLDRVPVIRLFGVTPGSQRACLEIHEVFPYFYARRHGFTIDEGSAAAFAGRYLHIVRSLTPRSHSRAATRLPAARNQSEMCRLCSITRVYADYHFHLSTSNPTGSTQVSIPRPRRVQNLSESEFTYSMLKCNN